ncbi:MCP four helix bundle domain-containing protein [Roseivirga sp.]|uniref:MCP four helix bundle domain-containing protein n=1 Tax=Roseivirga sp. TaxID=1964215 RepID=UPI003B519E29
MGNTSKKLKWTAGLVIVFLLIIATNLVDRQHFRRVKESVVAIYEDRLVAKDLVFELKLLVDQKRMAVVTDNNAFFENKNQAVNDSIQSLIDQFYATRLTTEERGYLDSFADKANQLAMLESQMAGDESDSTEGLVHTLNAIESDLYALSKIQLSEGKRQLIKATKSVNAMDYLTSLELIVLIIIAVCVNVIWLYKPKVSLRA